MRKSFKVMICATGLALMMGMTAYAGQWIQEGSNWKYQEDNGSYVANGWKWLDGNGDGTSECYYFDHEGHMLANSTTPDGYQVNGDGVWVKNDVVQIQTQEGNAADTERYKEIGGPNRLVSPNGLQGIYPFDRTLYKEFKSGSAAIGTHDYRYSTFTATAYLYSYNGENFTLGWDTLGGPQFPNGKWVVDNTKPEAVNGKTNIRYMFSDGTFAGYGFHVTDVSEEWSKENKALREAKDPDFMKFYGSGMFFSEDGYMYRNCYINTTSWKIGYYGGFMDRDYH